MLIINNKGLIMKSIIRFILMAGLLMTAASCGSKRSVKLSPTANEVFFRFDSYKIQRNYAQILDESFIYLRENPGSVIVLEGHTDHIGSVDYNFDLGDRRARVIKAYLVSKGVNPKRLIIASFGEVLPKYKNNIQKNRRVVLKDASE